MPLSASSSPHPGPPPRAEVLPTSKGEKRDLADAQEPEDSGAGYNKSLDSTLVGVKFQLERIYAVLMFDCYSSRGEIRA